VQLRSANPMDQPSIQPNYLSDPFDLECMVQATEFGRHIMSQSAMAGHILREHVPAEPLRTHDDYRKFVRQQAHAALHPVGTCKMGVDEMAVVDNTLRVHGIEGLRVADNSIAPSLCSSNTNALAIMIGEKAADHIRRAH
jgi:choline dehydrogenase-like flavoprotein